MGGSLMYVLLLCSTLPRLYSTQAPSHRHHSRLDTNPDELSPARPHYRTTTRKSFTVKDQFLLPEPPYGPPPRLASNLHDQESSDDYYDYKDYHPDGHHTTFAGSGAIHDYDHNSHGPDDTTTESQDEHVDMLDDDESGSAGHKYHQTKNASTAIACAWKVMLVSLLLTRMVALIQK